MRRYLKIVGGWLLVWVIISIPIALLLAGPGGAEVGAIFIVLALAVCLLCACVQCAVSAFRTRKRKHIAFVAFPAFVVALSTIYGIVESRKCKFPEDRATGYVVEHLNKSKRDPIHLAKPTLREKDCVYRFAYNGPSSVIYLYVSDWGNVGESYN